MPSYRPPVSRPQYHQLEVYFFRLVMYTDTDEYRQLSGKKQNSINLELSYIQIALNILAQLFDSKNNNERSVAAWKEHLDEGETHSRFFIFSSCKVAGKCLGLTGSNVSAVCRGKYPSFKGYVFQYEEDYIENKDHDFDASQKKFGLRNYLRDRDSYLTSNNNKDE